MESLRAWVMSLTGAAMISAVCLAIAPEGRTKKVVRLACGLLTLLCLASPLVKGKFDFANKLAAVSSGTNDFLSDTEESEKNVSRVVIQERYETYISDKGADLSLNISDVQVEMRWSSDGYWYPVSAKIKSDGNGDGTNALESCIVSELGIEAENIYWS